MSKHYDYRQYNDIPHHVSSTELQIGVGICPTTRQQVDSTRERIKTDTMNTKAIL